MQGFNPAEAGCGTACKALDYNRWEAMIIKRLFFFDLFSWISSKSVLRKDIRETSPGGDVSPGVGIAGGIGFVKADTKVFQGNVLDGAAGCLCEAKKDGFEVRVNGWVQFKRIAVVFG